MRALIAVFLLVCLPFAAAVAGQWCATSECPGCAAHGFGPGHGEECFSSQAACQARLNEVLSVSHSGITYSSCSERGGSGGSSSGGDLDVEGLRAQSQAAAPGHQMDPYINEAISRGMNGDIAAGDAMGLVGMGILGNAILSNTDPAQQAARRAAAEAAAAEAARRQAIEEEERKNRLLSGMLDMESGDAGGATPTADNPLGLMMDDNAGASASATSGSEQGFMANRTPRRQPNPQPPATRINPGPYNVPNNLGLMLDDTPPAPQPNPPPPPPPAGNPAMVAGAFNEGFVKGSQCFSNSAGAYCSAAGTDMQACINNYQAGFGQGEVLKRLQLQQARAAGAADRPGGRDNSFGSPMTQGPCRKELIDAYHEGFR